jgi:hypothetical protein
MTAMDTGAFSGEIESLRGASDADESEGLMRSSLKERMVGQ